jgi:hypothetical protein
MKRSVSVFAMSLIAVFLLSGFAFAQSWGNNQGRQPRDGACFYRDANFGGQSVCINAGESIASLPGGLDDRVSSIRVFGRAVVTVYENHQFSGPSEQFDRSMNDLSRIRKRDDPSRTWNDRISSVRVDLAGGGGYGRNDRDWNSNRDRDEDRDRDSYYGDNGGPRWGRENFRDAGACFYKEHNFGGDYFCMRRGQSFRSLPPGFNDRISSIRVFGGARVAIFQDNDFRGRQARVGRDIDDLHDRRTRDDPSRNWNDRISSIQVF